MVTPRLRELRPAHSVACHVATSDLHGEMAGEPVQNKAARG